MGVEAGRVALAAGPEGVAPETVLFATASPAYLDKTNATAIHAALALPESVPAYDMAGSVRSGMGALRLAAGVRPFRPGRALRHPGRAARRQPTSGTGATAPPPSC